MATREGVVRARDGVIATLHGMRDSMQAEGERWTFDAVDARLELLESYWNSFQRTQKQLVVEHEHTQEMQAAHLQVEQDTANLYIEVKTELTRLKRNKRDEVPPPAKIPKVADIRMSSFSGVYTDWTAWRSEFKAKVRKQISCCISIAFNRFDRTGHRHTVGRSGKNIVTVSFSVG